MSAAEWIFCRQYGCRTRDVVADLDDFARTRERLLALKSDSVAMSRLRDLLWSEGETHSWMLTDDAVIDQATRVLASGALHAHLPGRAARLADVSLDQRYPHSSATASSQAATGGATPTSDEAPPPPRVAPPPTKGPSSPAPPPPDAAIFDSSVDEGQQAGALAAAAEDGRPFCPQ